VIWESPKCGAFATFRIAAIAAWALTNTTTAQFAIGNRILAGVVGGAGGNAWEGPISEVVLTNSVLSSTDLSNLDAYFVSRWGT
jgi:hypothetical protein